MVYPSLNSAFKPQFIQELEKDTIPLFAVADLSEINQINGHLQE
jgi:hypothetical protein